MKKLTKKEQEIVQWFKDGWGMRSLAIRNSLDLLEIERVIRKAMKAQKELK